MVKLSSPIKIYMIFKEGERQCPDGSPTNCSLPGTFQPSFPATTIPLPIPPPPSLLLAWQEDVARCKGLRTLDPIATLTGPTKVKQRVNLMDYYDDNDDDDDDDYDDDNDNDDDSDDDE
uniref:Uncharacterized protein n=1 Tax=Vespula pensylvanica TaxID=30213 RepID=A0A834NJ36_VESPE|nr:hypothetical protein H0235_013492 [Vespula pensylvanica]